MYKTEIDRLCDHAIIVILYYQLTHLLPILHINLIAP